MTKDEALKLALEALKQIDEAMPFPVAKLAQKVIKEALAQPEPCGGCKGSGWVTRDPDIGTDQECFVCGGSGAYPKEPEQEPVGEIVDAIEGAFKCSFTKLLPVGTKLYTTPPKRPWVGLTDEEFHYCIALKNTTAIAEEVEAKLKERNT